MLTWSLVRHPASLTVPRLLDEVRSPTPQARSQALHTLSKIGEGWSAITPALLHDADDQVARAAWRAAVVLAPVERRAELAGPLASELGRGGRDLRLSLSRTLAELGDDATDALARARRHDDPEVRAHAIATERLILDPDEGFDAAMFEAKRTL